jgi:cis-3-alkyl-4-acyloxetan-2-one decarboxylase
VTTVRSNIPLPATAGEKHYPFTGHYLDLDGIRMHYLDEGEGGPVVMLHGNPSWSIYYRHLVTALRGDHRAIVPDHIGCGLSDKPQDGAYNYHLQRRVEDLERLLDYLNVRENLTLVLHDWGGMIGMVYAMRHPERIKRFVIFNTSAFNLPAAKRFPWALWLVRTPLGALLVRGFNAFSAVAARVGCKRNPMPPDLRKAYTAPYDSWRNRIATLRFVQDIPLVPDDISYELVHYVEMNVARFRRVPTLICWGMKDFVFDHHFLALWEQHFPQAEIHRFDDCGHYILEDAHEEIVPLVEDFLKRHPIDA